MKIYRLPPALKKRRSPVRRLVHLDCYRLASEKEAVDLGLLDYLGKPRTVVAVEWPEKIKKILKKFRVRRFAFSHLKNGGRKIAYSFPPPDISPKRTFST